MMMNDIGIRIDSGIDISIEIDIVIKSDLVVDFWYGHMVLILIVLLEGNSEVK